MTTKLCTGVSVPLKHFAIPACRIAPFTSVSLHSSARARSRPHPTSSLSTHPSPLIRTPVMSQPLGQPPQPQPPQQARSWSSSSSSTSFITYISAKEAAAIDEDLMSPEGCGFLLPQLMELAGLACAQALYKSYPPDVCSNLLVAAGPGNQGGDGLVAARHARLWGYNVSVWYPKQGKAELFQSLKKQLDVAQVPFVDVDDFDDALLGADVVLDCIFGFSFKGPPRPPFAGALEALGSESRLEFVGRVTRPPIVSVDIPSGWSVDGENESNPAADRDPTNTFEPEVVVSLTAPKKGIKGYRGVHFLGGRFIPESIAEKYKLEGLDGYQGDDQVVDITSWVDSETLSEETAA